MAYSNDEERLNYFHLNMNCLKICASVKPEGDFTRRVLFCVFVRL